MPAYDIGSPPPVRGLYPATTAYRTQRLKVDALHELHVEECGRPDGLPVVFLHGGPGGGIVERHRCFFDPARYRIVLIDQRGAGRSTPAGETRDNTTAHLVADLECLRRHLGIERWIVFGGSWGSTLALAYAQAHPDVVRALVLRGLFLGSQDEIDWLNERSGGARRVFPERWSAYEDFIPRAERDRLVDAYGRRLDDPDPAIRHAAGRAWRGWTGSCTSLMHDPGAPIELDAQRAALEARIEAHYFLNACFLADRQLLDGVDRIRHIPATLVQGRYDIACPMKSANDLARAWPELDLRIVLAGHSAFDEAIVDALARTTDALAAALSTSAHPDAEGTARLLRPAHARP